MRGTTKKRGFGSHHRGDALVPERGERRECEVQRDDGRAGDQAIQLPGEGQQHAGGQQDVEGLPDRRLGGLLGQSGRDYISRYVKLIL